MNTYQLECFLSLARNLNYARTSEEMNTSQPAITRQIQSLESELGVKLFNRSTRNVNLSADGKSFLADARSMIEISNRAKQKFDSKNRSEILNYAIGCSGIAHLSMMIPVLKELKSLYPALHPSITNLPLSQIMPKIDDGTVDVALGAKIENRKIKNCSYKELTRTRLACIFTKGHPIEKEKDITAHMLQQYPSILYNPTDIPTSVMKQQNLIVGNRPSSEICFCNSAEEAVILASAGIGLALIPELLIPKDRAYLDYRLMSDIPEISFGIYYKTGHLSNVSRDFTQLLAKSL